MTEVAAAPDPVAVPDTPAHVAPFSRSYTRYAMGLLLAIYIVNFLDRQVVNILAEPIKDDLKLADWQLGLMSGLAFAVFYTFLGIPIARLAERKNRPVIIGISVALWSGMTALCGAAQNFVQLVLFRIGVGVGEAGGTPPAHSLIVDYVPKEKRASALAFYAMGTPLGSLVGLVMGGMVADAYGWRAAFLVAGVPGLLFALLSVTTLKEPRRLLASQAAKAQANIASFSETMRYLGKKKTFWYGGLGAAIKAFIGYGHAPFTASFFLRNHTEEIAGLATFWGGVFGFNMKSVGFLGLALGVFSGVAGAFGSWFGGYVADRFGAKDMRAYMVAPAIAALVTIPIYIAALMVESAALGLVLLALTYFLGTIWYGPIYGTAQSVVPPHMRATAAAILLFVINLIGLGLGPLAVGALSDYLNVGMGLGKAEGIRWALIIADVFGVIAFACFWMARKTIREDQVG